MSIDAERCTRPTLPVRRPPAVDRDRRGRLIEADAPAVEQDRRVAGRRRRMPLDRAAEGEDALPFEEELALLGKEQAESA